MFYNIKSSEICKEKYFRNEVQAPFIFQGNSILFSLLFKIYNRKKGTGYFFYFWIKKSYLFPFIVLIFRI